MSVYGLDPSQHVDLYCETRRYFKRVGWQFSGGSQQTAFYLFYLLHLLTRLGLR